MMVADVVQSLAMVGDSLRRRFPRVLTDYEYLAPIGGGKVSTESVEVAAFLDEQQHDITTIAVAAKYYPAPPRQNPLHNGVGYLSPALLLSVTSQGIQWWVKQQPNAVIETQADDIETQFTHYRVLPDELRKARQGFQTSLFWELPDAVNYARDATNLIVKERFTEAVGQVYKQNGLSELTALGLDVLAAIILDDKREEIAHYAETTMARTPAEALRRAQYYFPESFDEIPHLSDDVADTFWRYLRHDMTYRSMSPDDLSDLLSTLYESVLLDKTSKRRQGSYYTPRNQARMVLAHLPVEEIAPEKRVVFDGTCGSGNLLRAASERLEPLFATKATTREEKADYLSKHLVGLDSDPFAINIARKTLLLSNYYDRDWNVRFGHFSSVQAVPDPHPTIVIANPPFGTGDDAEGVDRAAAFLRLYKDILRPRGLMGIFLPASFLQRSNDAALRRQILEECDVLEVWKLPEGAIPHSGVAMAVLMLRKCDTERKTTRVYIVDTKEQVDAFAEGKSANQSLIVDPDQWLQDKDARIGIEALGDIWSRLESRCDKLVDVYGRVENGVQTRKGRGQLAKEPREGFREVLSRRTGLDPYAIQWDRQDPDHRYIFYPDDLERRKELRRPKKKEHFDHPRLVIQGMRNATSPWRLVAAVDEGVLVVRETFHYVVPRAHTSLLVLCAILNGPIANAWYNDRDVERNVSQTLLNTLPIPMISSTRRRRIERLVRDVIKDKQQLWGSAPAKDRRWEPVRAKERKIDDLIYEAYDLSHDERARIEAALSRAQRPGEEWRNVSPLPSPSIDLQPPPSTPLHSAAGKVYSIDLVQRMMEVDMPGIARRRLVFPIPPAVPGWALQYGGLFFADIPVEQVDAIADREDDSNVSDSGPLVVDRVDLYNVSLRKRAYMGDDDIQDYLQRHVYQH